MAAAGALGIAEELGFVDELTNLIGRLVSPGSELKGAVRQSVVSNLSNSLNRGVAPSIAFRTALSNLLGSGNHYNDVRSISPEIQNRLTQIEHEIEQNQHTETSEGKDVFIDIPLDEPSTLRNRSGRRPVSDISILGPLGSRNLIPTGSVGRSQDPTVPEIARSNPFYNPFVGRNLRPSLGTLKKGAASAAAGAIASTVSSAIAPRARNPFHSLDPVQPTQPANPVAPTGPSYNVGENPNSGFEGPLPRPIRRPPTVIQPVRIINNGAYQDPVTTDTYSFPDSGVRGKYVRRDKGVFYPSLGEPYMQAMIHNLFLN
jgi:hypothetical protein